MDTGVPTPTCIQPWSLSRGRRPLPTGGLFLFRPPGVMTDRREDDILSSLLLSPTNHRDPLDQFLTGDLDVEVHRE